MAADIQAALCVNGRIFRQGDRALKRYLCALDLAFGAGTQVFEYARLQCGSIRRDGYGRAF